MRETRYTLGFIESKHVNEDMNVLLLITLLVCISVHVFIVQLFRLQCVPMSSTVNHLGQKIKIFLCGFNICGFHV